MDSIRDKSLIIHLIEGLSKGAKEIKLNEFSSIRALFLPKTSLKSKRKLFQDLENKSCLYFLFNSIEDKVVYIGQTDSILQRLENHFSKKDWWVDSLIIFYTFDNSLTKTDTIYLEKLFVSKVSKFSEYKLKNKVEPYEKNIEKYKLPAIKEFESTIYLIMGILNLEIFEEFKIKTIEIEDSDKNYLVYNVYFLHFVTGELCILRIHNNVSKSKKRIINSD
jgi:predicted GIY-YIG superfamily endonuclease